ncbi:MAG: polymorphic toxin-type HINT domain-containing protein [Coriobacteriia bacterium]|nr:polymorphic toxin-type HINT domain-containing protein [Coriobacteriia bacterium]
MATIELFAAKINMMPSLIGEAKKAVLDYKTELEAIRTKALAIDASALDLSDIIASVKASTEILDRKADSLDALNGRVEQFISDVVRIDQGVAELIRLRKKEFYDAHPNLKPESEKSRWEKICDGLATVGQWCKEHWKLIVTVILVIVAVVLICTGVGGPFAAIILAAAKGLIIGAITGGLMGGAMSYLSGGSFWEGFENGAFSGALTGALFGGLGAAGAMFGQAFGASCQIFNAIKYISFISGSLSMGMSAFDMLAFGLGLLDPNNPLTLANQWLHNSTAYNVFQFTVSAVAVFSGSAYNTMKPMDRACFVAGTLVMTASGFVAIESIVAGDTVVSTDPDTLVTGEKQVIKTFINEASELVHVLAGGEEIIATADHPFYVAGKGWTAAADLAKGSTLLLQGDSRVIVDGITLDSLDEPVAVYNLEVADWHTYHVGIAGLLVHNDCAPRQPRSDLKNVEYHEDGSVTYTKTIDGKDVSITYNSEGYPDFSPYAHPDHPNPVEIEYTGSRSRDYGLANHEAGLSATPDGYTWHHMEDGKGMLLVETSVHDATTGGFAHTGGFSINRVK